MSSTKVTRSNNKHVGFNFVAKTREIQLRPDFERQLDDAKQLFETLKYEQILLLLRELISLCSYSQTQTLWTAFQPLLHRDFLFMGQRVSPEANLTPISTAVTRQTRNHLIQTRNISRYHRIQSAHIATEDEVRVRSKLPPIGHGNYLITSQKDFSDLKSRKRKNAMKAYIGIKTKDDVTEKINDFITCFKSWTNPERTILFRQLLHVLSPKHFYFVCTLLSVKQNSDILIRLPTDIALRILSYLTAEQLAISSTVSKQWRELCLNDKIWRQKCTTVRSELSTPANFFTEDFYTTFKKNEIRKQNWKKAQCEHIHMEGHAKKVLVVTLRGRVLASAAADATIKLWDVDSQMLLQTLTGHKKGVWSLSFFTSKLLVSGSTDTTVKVWNIEQGRCLRTLFGHTGAVWAVACKKHVLASGGHDKLIKVWNLKHSKLMRTLKGHGSAVFAVDLSDDSNLLFSGSADHSARIWRISEGKCLRIIWTSNSSPVMSVSAMDDFFVFTSGKNLTLWNVPENQEIKTYKGHKCRIENAKLSVKRNDDKVEMSVVTGGRDGRVRHWTLHGNEHYVKTMCVHPHQVNCIAFDKRRIIIALCDNTICLCDFTAKEDEPISREST